MTKDSATKKDWKDSANKRRTRSLIGNGLIALFEVHDEIPISHHIMYILRPKGKKERKEVGEQVYSDFYMDDQSFLKALETYTRELQDTKMEDEDNAE